MIFDKKINFENLNLTLSISVCLCISTFYVISLYLWSKQNRYNRNEPSVIKRRFISVILSSMISYIIIYLISSDETGNKKFTLTEWIGLRFDIKNFFNSILVSLGLTAILFAGPIIQYIFTEYRYYLESKLYEINKLSNSQSLGKNINHINNLENFIKFFKFSLRNFLEEISFVNIFSYFTDLHFLRNYVISTFTEEFVFRSCMLPLMTHHMNWVAVMLITPLFFGTAHLHHIYEGFKAKEAPFNILLMRHLFQFAYTYNFGVYSSFLFLRTGSFFSSFQAHSFCNLMGFPNVDELVNDFDKKTKILLMSSYVLGLFSFFYFINSMTNPIFFNNYVYSDYF
ncbi:unnamed protein product [Brachionus calyciflorus]|uniref:CAAX prenyl protease 2 n=1 Tax=Brachionus calyciflorus TaxID=104777 RepID=A0A813ZWJ7_9BILA|nr:unnamed protein product [Brachionus calyciflorus]